MSVSLEGYVVVNRKQIMAAGIQNIIFIIDKAHIRERSLDMCRLRVFQYQTSEASSIMPLSWAPTSLPVWELPPYIFQSGAAEQKSSLESPWLPKQGRTMKGLSSTRQFFSQTHQSCNSLHSEGRRKR